MRKKMINLSAALLGSAVVASTLFSCSSRQQESPMKAKVEEYASVELKSDLVNNLSDKEKELVRIFFQVGKITDDLFWKQTFGDKSKLDTITDSYAKQFAMIQYGAWDRLDDNNLSWLVMVRNRMYAIIIRLILQRQSLMHLRMPIRTHGIPSSVAMTTVL